MNKKRNEKIDQQEEREILKQSVIEDEGLESSDGLSLAEKLQEQKKKQKKKTIKRAIWGGLACLIAYGVWWGIKPFKSSAEYGICRTFLELSLPYPHTLHVGEMKFIRDGGMQLWYSYIDGFGEYRNEDFTCYLQQNPETGQLQLSSLKFRKISLEAEKIASLNSALVYFQANPLILNWPAPLPNNLSDLHFESDLFRIQLDITKR